MAGTHSLIWAEGMTGERALAPALRRWMIAAERAADRTLSAQARVTATIEADEALVTYERLVGEAEATLKTAAEANPPRPRTHMLVVGIGRYSDAKIPAVTTSVHGATAFVDWALNRFRHLDRPLGSMAMLLSPPSSLPAWTPKEDAAGGIHSATRLGLTPGDTLPLESATFGNIKAAFGSMLARARSSPDNAVWFYVAGHGVWKTSPYVLSEDAAIADGQKGFDNLIDPQLTMNAMMNTLPETQVFIIETCQEILAKMLSNLSAAPGRPLWDYPNAAALEKRDNVIYLAAYPGEKTGGLADQPPIFTKALLECLDRFAANNRAGEYWEVTSESLAKALRAAGMRQGEQMATDIRFSTLVPGQASFGAILCHVATEPEVLLRVRCRPIQSMAHIRPYVERNGKTERRETPSTKEWVTCVSRGSCVVGAEAIPPSLQSAQPEPCEARPPVEDVTLAIADRGPA